MPIVEETGWASEPVWTGCALNGIRSPEHPARRDSLHQIRCPVYKKTGPWPRGLRRRSAAVRLLGLWVRIPAGHGWLSFVSVVLSGRGLYDGLITRPEESYRLCCVVCVSYKPRE